MLLLSTAIRQKIVLALKRICYICIIQTRFIQTLNNRVDQKKHRCNEEKIPEWTPGFFYARNFKVFFLNILQKKAGSKILNRLF